MSANTKLNLNPLAMDFVPPDSRIGYGPGRIQQHESEFNDQFEHYPSEDSPVPEKHQYRSASLSQSYSPSRGLEEPHFAPQFQHYVSIERPQSVPIMDNSYTSDVSRGKSLMYELRESSLNSPNTFISSCRLLTDDMR